MDGMEVIAVRSWLAFLVVVEVPELFGYLLAPTPKTFDETFGSNLHNAGAERRLWCVFLTLLVLARLALFAAPRSAPVAAHCAAVHAVEAVYFLGEFFIFGSAGGKQGDQRHERNTQTERQEQCVRRFTGRPEREREREREREESAMCAISCGSAKRRRPNAH